MSQGHDEDPQVSEEETHAVANGAEQEAQDEQAAQEAEQAKVVSQAAAQAAAAEEEMRMIMEIFQMARQQRFLAVTEKLTACPQYWTAKDEDGHCLLHWGALVGNLDFVKKAMTHGCPVDSQARNLQTPLMWAVLRGHIQCARVLLDAKADPQHHDSLGATPLMIAVQHRNYQSLLLLMKRGGETLILDGDKNGCTPAHWAAYKGDLTALKLLDYFGADLNRVDNAGMMPLHRATCAAEGLVIEFLVEKKCDLMTRNKEGNNCLDIAEKQQNERITHLLKRLSKGADAKDEEEDDEGGGDPEKGKAEGEKKKEKPKESMFAALTKDKAAQKIFPVFWLVCVSMAMFEYITDLRTASYEAAPMTSMLFEIGVPASIAIFFLVALGDPGLLPPGRKGKSGVEEIMKGLDSAPIGQEPDISRLCTTTWVLKDLRTKYCAQTGGCIEEFDHYCVWLNTSIGKKNHRQFYMLAVVEWITQVTHIYLLWCMAWHLVPYTSFGGWIAGVITGFPLLTMMAIIQTLTVPWIACLIYQQGKLIVMNMTTNEMMNMHRESYSHFWVVGSGGMGRMQKSFQNPFDKGSKWKNCMDFWWARRRSVTQSQSSSAQGSCPSKCCAHQH